jgi:FAD/FMN-containing dehydrogenase
LAIISPIEIFKTAFVHRGDEFLLEYTVTSDSAQPAASPHAATEWLGQIRDLLNGYGTGRAYQNFADPELTDPLRAYYGQNLSRLGEVKRHNDPDNFFNHGQSIPPTPRRDGVKGVTSNDRGI